MADQQDQADRAHQNDACCPEGSVDIGMQADLAQRPRTRADALVGDRIFLRQAAHDRRDLGAGGF